MAQSNPNGAVVVQGTQINGQPIPSPADGGIRISIQDGTSVRDVLGDSGGRQIVVGSTADGSAAVGAPLPVAGKGADGNIHAANVNPSNELHVTTAGLKATYSVAVNAHAPAATPTDWFTIQGSSTKTIRITRIAIALRATAASQYRVSLIKYSAYLTGGTLSAVTIVPHDSSNAAATAVVDTWAGGLPTPGTPVGKIADDSLPVGVLGTPTFNNEVVLYDFGVRNGQGIVLRGVAQYLAINSGGAALPAGLVADVRVEWTEEA